MMLPLLLVILFVTGGISLVAPHYPALQKMITLTGLLLACAMSIAVGITLIDNPTAAGLWLIEWQRSWIPSWGISVHFGIDGFSWWLIILTLVMGIIASIIAQPKARSSSYYAALSWTIFGVIGLFMAADLFLFFVFWELSLLPVYWILLAHGLQQSRSSAFRYVMYTQISGLILLLSVLGLAFYNAQSTGMLTFDYAEIVGTPIDADVQHYLFLGFLLAFLIKLPSVPFHGWLAGVFKDAPVPIILVGVLIKTAVFGLVRFGWPLFPDSCATLQIPIMLLGVFSIMYGAIVALSQREPNRVLAYGTLSHAGMLLIGVFCNNQPSFLGVLVLLICQAFSTTALLMIMSHFSTVDLRNNHGLWKKSPTLALVILIFLLAGLGFPLFGNFVGEWLVVWGTFASAPLVSVLAAFGLVLGAVYSLWMFQKICWGPPSTIQVPLIKASEKAIYGFLIFGLLALGFYPSMIINSLSIQTYSSLHTAPAAAAELNNPQVALP